MTPSKLHLKTLTLVAAQEGKSGPPLISRGEMMVGRMLRGPDLGDVFEVKSTGFGSI